ncbi:MAG: hypothetical protein PHP12_04130 [Bacilli bacterium]|nr:hypothetical protein [Bacilli bacterium]
MNVIISNRYKSMLQTLDIEIIKAMDGEFEIEEIISSFQNFYFQRIILDITAVKNYKDIKNLQKLSMALDMDKVILLLDDSMESASGQYLSKLISMGIYNFTKNIEGIKYLYEHPNSYRDVAHIHQLEFQNPEVAPKQGETSGSAASSVGTRIIAIKNITKQSGATTLIYMLKKQLQKYYNVLCVEVDKRDFVYFRDKDLVTASNNELNNIISKAQDVDVILLDVNNNTTAEQMATEVIYLIEPSIIKLNKIMMLNSKALEKYQGKLVVLNQSLLSSKDVLDFEYESRLKIFYNLPPLDDREKNPIAINKFLQRLGFDKINDKR